VDGSGLDGISGDLSEGGVAPAGAARLQAPRCVGLPQAAPLGAGGEPHAWTRAAGGAAQDQGQRPADVLKIKREDLRDGALWIVQNKTKAKRAIELTGELAALIERINARPRERLSAWLIQDDDGKPLGTFGMRSRFDKARRLAGVEFQFRDIRAKAATDTGDLAHSQKLLGHRNREMTEHYVRQRVGERVQPLR